MTKSLFVMNMKNTGINNPNPSVEMDAPQGRCRLLRAPHFYVRHYEWDATLQINGFRLD